MLRALPAGASLKSSFSRPSGLPVREELCKPTRVSSSPKDNARTYIFTDRSPVYLAISPPPPPSPSEESAATLSLSTRLFVARDSVRGGVSLDVILLTSKNRFRGDGGGRGGEEARYPRDNSRIPAVAAGFPPRARLAARGERGGENDGRREVSRKPANQCNFIHFLLARGGL